MLSTKDIADLEKKYSKYIFKKRFKSFLSLLLALLVFSAALYYYFFYYQPQTEVTTQNLPIKKIEDKNITILLNKKEINKSSKKISLPPKETQKEIKKVILPKKEQINSVDLNESNTTKDNNNSQDDLAFRISPSDTFSIDRSNRGKLIFKYSNLKKTTTNSAKTKPNITKNNDKNVTITNKKRKRPKIHIEMRDIDSIKYLNDKFKKTHDIVFALMLCETYYKQKDYQNSLKWSIIANDIDSGSERSWMWFAKSKYRLHQKDDAIKALRSFLQTNSSEKIKSLLRDIVNGELND